MNNICSACDTFVCVRTVCSDNQCKLLVTTVDEWINYNLHKSILGWGSPLKIPDNGTGFSMNIIQCNRYRPIYRNYHGFTTFIRSAVSVLCKDGWTRVLHYWHLYGRFYCFINIRKSISFKNIIYGNILIKKNRFNFVKP